MKKIILFIVIFSVIGCVSAELQYPQMEIMLKVNKKYNIQISSGKFEVKKSFKNFNITKVTFNKVRGGKSFIFGIEINDAGNGYKVKRLNLLKENNIVKSYSYNEILKMKTEVIDTFKVYVVPD